MKYKITLYILLLFLSFTLNSQIRIVCPSMRLGIGLTNNPIYWPVDFLGPTAIRPSAANCFPYFEVCNSTDWEMLSSERFMGKIGGNSGILYALESKYVYGTIVNTSDSRLKKNMVDLSGMLNTIDQLHPVTFDYNIDYSGLRNEESRTKLISWDQGRTGFVAQEVQQIFPHLVKTNEADSMLYIEYTGLIPVLTQGMKEQNAAIISLLKEIRSCISGPVENTESGGTDGFLFASSAFSYGRAMEIAYIVPENPRGIELLITDMQSNPLVNIPITDTGLGRIAVPAFSLPPGMYYSVLLLDKKQSDRKMLIVTQ